MHWQSDPIAHCDHTVASSITLKAINIANATLRTQLQCKNERARAHTLKNDDNNGEQAMANADTITTAFNKTHGDFKLDLRSLALVCNVYVCVLAGHRLNCKRLIVCLFFSLSHSKSIVADWVRTDTYTVRVFGKSKNRKRTKYSTFVEVNRLLLARCVLINKFLFCLFVSSFCTFCFSLLRTRYVYARW